MKEKINSNNFSLDDELLTLFKEVFSDDEASYKEAVRDAKRAFSFIRKMEMKHNSNNVH